jgi:hypothetical protein
VHRDITELEADTASGIDDILGSLAVAHELTTQVSCKLGPGSSLSRPPYPARAAPDSRRGRRFRPGHLVPAHRPLRPGMSRQR